MRPSWSRLQKSVDVQAARLATARDAEKASLEQARANEREIAEAARRKTQDAGETTRAAERAAQDAIAAAEKIAAEASDRHTDVARRTDQLRTRMAATEQALAEITGDVADAEMRRTFRQARLSAISDTQADRVAAGKLAHAHRRAARRAGRSRRQLRSPGARVRHAH